MTESGAVDMDACPLSTRCRCERCMRCGHRKHMAIHGPHNGEPPGSNPYGHEFKPRKDTEALLDHAEVVADFSVRYGLTPRESEVLGKLLLGHDNLEIARRLSVKIRTAKTHVEHIWKKTGAHSRAQLMGLLFGEVR